MIKRKTEKVYYESEIIEEIICDDCNKTITNEEFFTLELKFMRIGRHNQFIEKVYDENGGVGHLCKECAAKRFDSFNNPIREYLWDSLM